MVIQRIGAAVLFFLISAAAPLWAEETVSGYSRLLEGFLAQDTQGRRLALETERAALELQKYALENRMSFSVSTGDTVLSFAPSGVSVSARPGTEITFPSLRNSGLNLDVPLESRGDRISSYGLDMTVKTGIITGQGELYRSGFEEQRRRLLMALRNQENRRLLAEKEFCEKVKQLLSYRSALLEARSETILARYDLELKRLGGYAPSAVALRTAELKLRSREREEQEAGRILDTALRDFAAECSAEEAGIPEDIPDESLLDIAAFDPAAFAELEEARWVNGVNSLSRKGRDRPFSLDGTAGYSWRGSPDSASGGLASGFAGGSGGGNSSSVSAGALFSAGGISASAKVSVPLEKPGEPSVSFMFQWKPFGMKTARIDRRLRGISAEQELLAIAGAEKKFRILAVDYQRKKADLEWQRETYEEEEEIYRLNAGEQQAWFSQGIIRETDYLSAQTDHLRSVNRLLTARIDRRLYNLELRALFVPQVDEKFRADGKLIGEKLIDEKRIKENP